VAIRLLQDAAERGEIDPWDVDVIAVIDGFLDQLRQTLDLPRQLAALGGSYEQGLAASSEAFLAASMLVALKAEHLEERTLASKTVSRQNSTTLVVRTAGRPGWPCRPGRNGC
jgi:segregation and condensation protein A